MTLTTEGTVQTDAGPRYAKQLASHLGRRSTIEETETGVIVVLSATQIAPGSAGRPTRSPETESAPTTRPDLDRIRSPRGIGRRRPDRRDRPAEVHRYPAPYWAVRHGTRDRDTAFTVSINLDRALKADPSVKGVDYRLSWTPHMPATATSRAMAWIARRPGARRPLLTYRSGFEPGRVPPIATRLVLISYRCRISSAARWAGARLSPGGVPSGGLRTFRV